MFFGSRLERQIALPVLFGLVLPLLAGTIAVSQQLNSQAIAVAEDRLKRDAKDAGMALLTRLRDAFGMTLEGSPENRGRLSFANSGELVYELAGDRQTVRTEQLDQLLTGSTAVGICVSWPERPCVVDADAISARWTLRLVSLFDTQASIQLVASQSRSDALGNLLLGTSLLPLILLLLLLGALAYVMRALRRHMRPVPAISAALKQLEGGDRNIALEIEADNELATLGTALKSLSGELEDEFTFRDTVSQLDNQILLARDLSQTLQRIERAAEAFCSVARVRIRPLGSAATIESLTPGSDVQQLVTLSIKNGDSPWGTLIAEPVGEVSLQRLKLLARRASVAMTSAAHAQQLIDRATYDSLTGLLNRSAFRTALEEAAQKSSRLWAQPSLKESHQALPGVPLIRSGIGPQLLDADSQAMATELQALLFLDLDRFKLLNDTQGHSSGDLLLRGVAERLREVAPEGAAIARFGGDEFALLISGLADEQTLLQLVESISNAISQPIPVGNYTHKIDSSIGVCLLGEDGDDPETLLKNADIAMYAAKAAPGSSYRLFNAAMDAAARRRVVIETRLQQALKSQALEVYLQPKFDLRKQATGEAEALLRWHDSELGSVSPTEFIPIAEHSGLIVEMTNQVIDQVGALLRTYPPTRLRRVAINVSPMQLATANFEQHLLAKIDAQQQPRGRFQVEITESVMIENSRVAISKLKALRDAGLTVALDDFGTGYSSLNLLTELPIDYLKIDKSFVDSISEDGKATLVLRKIIEMAQGLGIETVAEGVETQGQFDALAAMGIHQIQGYLISKPLHPTALGAFLKGESTPVAAVAAAANDGLLRARG